jgi:hypothetical protein
MPVLLISAIVSSLGSILKGQAREKVGLKFGVVNLMGGIMQSSFVSEKANFGGGG